MEISPRIAELQENKYFQLIMEEVEYERDEKNRKRSPGSPQKGSF